MAVTSEQRVIWKKNYNRCYAAKHRESIEGKYTQWKNGAKARGYEWGLTIEFLRSLPLVCHYTGQELTLEIKQPNTVSLDRIDNTRGYLPDNVCFTTWKINKLKQAFKYDEFIGICVQIAAKHGK